MKRTILIVVDMQNDFVDGALGSADAAGIVDNVANKIRAFEGEIFVTYDTHQENYMETREGKYLPIPHCIQNTDGWMLNPKIQAALDIKTYTKFLKPTFGSTALVKALCGCDERNTEVTLIGLCTDICVVSNAMLLKANYPEMDINVIASCCAGVTRESHEAALATMKCCQINIL